MEPVDTHDSTKMHFDKYPHQQHAILLYRHGDDQDTPTTYVNEALNRGYLTIYLPITKTSLSKSIDYEEKEEKNAVNRDNLLTIDIRTFYNFALAGDLQPFEELKVLIEEAIEEKRRIASKRSVSNEEVIVVVLAGVSAELARSGKFDECVKVEEW